MKRPRAYAPYSSRDAGCDDARAIRGVYPLGMKRWRTFLERLPGGHRPPTGPLTTKEAADAEELRQKTLPTDDEASGPMQEDARDPEA